MKYKIYNNFNKELEIGEVEINCDVLTKDARLIPVTDQEGVTSFGLVYKKEKKYIPGQFLKKISGR